MNDDIFVIPNSEKKVLIHSCCAPCSGELMEKMVNAGIELTIFFYNPNIHPKKEYEIRKSENIRFAEKMNIPFIDADYDVQNWFTRAKGMEHAPEHKALDAQCVLICVLNALHFTLSRMASKLLLVLLAFPVGEGYESNK